MYLHAHRLMALLAAGRPDCPDDIGSRHVDDCPACCTGLCGWMLCLVRYCVAMPLWMEALPLLTVCGCALWLDAYLAVEGCGRALVAGSPACSDGVWPRPVVGSLSCRNGSWQCLW